MIITLTISKQKKNDLHVLSHFFISIIKYSIWGTISSKYQKYNQVNVISCDHAWELVTIWGKLHDVSILVMSILNDRLGKYLHVKS